MFNDQSWELISKNKNCLFAGSRQGGRAGETSPNDPVIRGKYMDYAVSGPFETQFKYSIFNKTLVCRP